ncbi:MAG: cyclic nucleotide-binding domain-containing protein [Candidatus Binataceae bacterium]
MPTPLETMLLLSWMAPAMRIAAEAVLTLAVLAAAFAMRRRWAFKPGTFILMAAGVALNEAAHSPDDPAIAAKVAAAAFAIFMLGVIRLVFEGIDEAKRRRRAAPFPTIFKDLMVLVLWAAVLMAVLYTDFGFKPYSILTISSVSVGGLLLALRETLSNIFTGLTLQTAGFFKTGDWISSAGTLGRVQGIGWRTTTIVTRTGERVEIPNATVAREPLVNYATGAVRDEIGVGLSYGVAPNHVREVVLKLLHDVPEILRDPAPVVMAWEYGESSIQYRVKYWLSDWAAQERVRDRVVSSLWYALRRHSIEIPFPIRTIQMREARADQRSTADFERELMAEMRAADILRGLSDDDLRVLVPSVTLREFGAGEILVRQGEAGETFYVIRNGEVEVIVKTADGESRRVTTLGRAQFFGEAALLLGEARNATVRALTDVEVIEMDRVGFTSLFKENPEAGELISEVIATRESERLEAAMTPDDRREGRTTGQWLLAKMRRIFDF